MWIPVVCRHQQHKLVTVFDFPVHKAGIENYSFFPAAKLNDEQLKREMQLG